MSDDWTFVELGAMPWTEARERLAGRTCAWLDFDGFRVGEPPAEAPITTCLWGWSDGWYLRARLDEDRAYLGALRPGTPNGPGEEAVTVALRKPVLRVTEATAGLEFDLLEVPGARPVTFVRPAAPTPPGNGDGTCAYAST